MIAYLIGGISVKSIKLAVPTVAPLKIKETFLQTLKKELHLHPVIASLFAKKGTSINGQAAKIVIQTISDF